MAIYEHFRQYKVVDTYRDAARLQAPRGRQYWERWLNQSVAKFLFKRKLKKGDTVVFRRVSTPTTTFYVASKLI
jgi:hypothetical protein